jgi:hypothetical protein
MLSLPSRGSSGASDALEPRDDIIDVYRLRRERNVGAQGNTS